ncbi:dynein heavy chain, cytoplasmic isoform X3 [Amyelois transitella]|uniref:dynein heavy chain, cytoplasmic isoform X3 n=1 Tax=Amyelois transitella TaxID=680683 RepID=UPI0029903376|nr:dynein heavy chain, cytoplasmic isoform X3 [Amyelois transitella]
MGDSLDGSENAPEAQNVVVVDFQDFANYLRRAATVLLPEDDIVPPTLNAALDDKVNQDCIRKFICDPQVSSLYVQRFSSKEDDNEQPTEGEEEKEAVTYQISNEVHFTSPRVAAFVCIKRGAVIEADKSIHSQLRLINLSDGSPYETLHAFISKTMAPFFKSYVKESGRADRDGDKMAPSVEKKIAELEMGLLHLQQNIDIPEITLPVHPVVAAVIKRAADEGRKPRVADFGDKVEDSTFLNQLQNGVNRWIKEIQKVTKLDRDPSNGTALQEISFWLNLERALHRIQEKRESIEVALTLEILKYGKRFHATVSFDTDTGLKQALATVSDYNPLMKDFPINDLLSATELERIRLAVQQIFSHLRKIRSTKYPIQRGLRLVEAISRDLSQQLLKVLGTRRLMHIPFEDFERVMTQCFEVFSCWDDEYEKLQGLLRDIVKKKRDEHLKMVWRVSPSHKRLQARMEHMRRFRRHHEQLRTVMLRVLRPRAAASAEAGGGGDPAQPHSLPMDAADANAIAEVNLAYENVKEVDCLDISREGCDAWEAAVRRYEDRIDRVETRITAHLRDQLGTAKNANEMFRIFSRFNALFVRPHIRGAIREYQTQLIQRVKDDIETLHEKFKVQYPQSKCSRLSLVRDLPPVAGSIIWAKQIDHQLTAYLKRVEDVLGKGWENHIEGQKLKADGDSFRLKLDTQEVFDDWARKVQQRNLGVYGRIFAIESVRARSSKTGTILKLKVNFLPEIITLYKEVRNLKNLGFRVPLAIVNKAHQANQLYPFAISLIESVRTYERTLEKIRDKASIIPLVAGLRRDVLNQVSEGMALVWESYKLDPFVQKLSEVVLLFQEKVEDLLAVEEQISVDARSLETCPYSAQSLADILSRLQRAVDDLSLRQYSNLHLWVQRLDEEVEKSLAARLQAGVEAWTMALLGKVNELDLSMDTYSPAEPTHKPGGEPQIARVVHEVRITNQQMYLFPSLEEARFQLMRQMFAWQAVVTSQQRLQSTRYQVGVSRAQPATYRNLLTKLPGGSAPLENAYDAIEQKISQVREYVDEWLRYQALWDLQPESLYGRLGEDITLWIKCLNDIKKSRTTFDTSDTRREYGPVVIDFARVQSKVALKYDAWHKEVLGKFGALLGGEMVTFHSQLAKSRSQLEQQTIEAASTSDAVSLITYVQQLKREVLAWEKQVDIYREAQRILERQRFQFPAQWLHVDNIEGEWSAFNEIMRRKDSSIQTQVASLQQKIVAEDKAVEARTLEFLGEWERSKPTDGSTRPEDALARLQAMETRYTRLKDERDNVAKAKEALELHDTGTSVNNERMTVALEELQDLRGVWSSLSKIWTQIDDIREKPWLSVQPRKLRQQLEAMLNELKELPARLRMYDSYEYVRKLLQSYTKVNMLIVELKSDALKERHWRQLCRALKVDWSLSELTLGQVWDADLLHNEHTVKDVVSVAQGEMALEEFLKQVRESWQSYELDLINYQNKCKIIRGWDDLFNKVKEHINSVAAMKLSPYYKVFEEEALTWEEKLNRINALFDVWIDVQRRWVYLEGIFSGSADIKTLLPVETSRFQSISSEFLGLMKKVSKSPMVMDVLNIPGVQRSLERLADLLGKIQKALGEYLERERSSFPRFYFVGDEDLLEIIGNSKNIARLQKHFKKMFAGVAAIILNEDNTVINGIASREGEEVYFMSPVSTIENPKINSWLSMVEREMRVTLACRLKDAVGDVKQFKDGNVDPQKFIDWCDKYQAQIVVLAAQILWSEDVEAALTSGGGDGLKRVLAHVENMLNILADSVLQEQPPLRRRKLEHLINEFVHKRTVTRRLIASDVNSPRSFEWLCEMRFYFDPRNNDVLQQLTIHMANAKFLYGFEYLGVQDRLVQTPLTDRCYLTMTQALEARLGGSPFGPAGTGKTESVKALGNQLGRFVLVFNCDETFDFQAMGRIFVGLCQVGAWGCFDEFNRLEERMLSAVSQQVQTIQEALKSHQEGDNTTGKSITVELVGKQVRVSQDMAIFITMNPGYAGRSNLPDNLKKLFRSLAMTTPDRQLIAEVMLFSQGFRTAEKLACKIVPFFKLCDEQLSNQSHYDFGLRALKSVLVSAGNVKRDRIQKIKENLIERGTEVPDEASIAESLPEQDILIQSVCETMVPKLVAEDIPLLFSLLNDVFPNVGYTRAEMTGLKNEIRAVCAEEFLVCGEGDEQGSTWMDKVLQLYQICKLNHGLMMVGPSGSGKSTAWRVLLKALERYEGVEGVAHVIDPKAMSKETLYGVLDPNTREWTDGLFTHILRKIIDNVRGEINKRQWIIFDGDVDPEWVENLNSVLDDNKLLTLPNGERLSLPPNVRVMFEVQDLKYATLATVSRCGMVWFSQDVLTTEMIFENYLMRLRNIPLEDGDEDSFSIVMAAPSAGGDQNAVENILSPALQTQRDVAAILQPLFFGDGLVVKCLERAASLDHIMDFTRHRALSSLHSMLNRGVRNILAYNRQHPDFPITNEQLEAYVPKWLVYSLLWSFAGDAKLKDRNELGDFIRSASTMPLPNCGANQHIIDFEVSITGEWVPWSAKVPQIEVETHKVAAPDVVVPTLDTVRHEALLYTWLAEHKPLVLCGPPGSGKTMTLFSALRALPDMEVVGLNFSSATTPELLLKTFDHYCEYRKTPNGVVLAPVQLGKWLVLFCDEINLPDMDQYGTQRVISFLRQLLEHKGFYRASDHSWVHLERIQFVGACNPPTDPGRKPLSHRLLRHVPVIYVDYPGETSLEQIYGTFTRAMLRMQPALRGYAEPLTQAMVKLYLASQERFTQDMQPHYVYSPREMTRWVRGICEAIRPLDNLSVEGLVRLWAHEALRLFQDRLVEDSERQWTDENIDNVAMMFFPGINREQALGRPILYSNWLSKDYIPVERDQLREYVKARLKVFYEEELDVPLVLFDEVLDHVLRIDRIFRQPQGHLLLIGVSGAGKTTLSRFVAWMNGLSIFQIKVHNKYTGADFDEDLRSVLRRAGCRDEKVAFILDESNVLDSGFLERMNTLLANGEVPGLFEGDEFAALMTQCKEGAQREGLMLDSNDELYKWFTGQVMRNLHVVFTMNPSSEGLKDRAATSPALFNRCVLNWFGDWSDGALFQVGKEFTSRMDLDCADYVPPEEFPAACGHVSARPHHREAVVNACVYVHQTLHRANARLAKRANRTMAITPRHYLDFIQQMVKLYAEKRADLEEQQLHLNVGLGKIAETVEQVEEMQKSLAVKSQELQAKNEAANAKLRQMVKDQQEAEKKKVESQEIQVALEKQTKEIEAKRRDVMADLAQVEPAVIEAQNAVKSIKKQHLVEVRSMGNPPAIVKVALESICLLLGENATDWKAIRAVIMRENFINSIVSNFSTEDITDDVREKMKTRYLSNPDYNFEKVNRASMACGPMVKWAIAQIEYADMLKRVEPLRNELKALEDQAQSNVKAGDEVRELIAQLEKSIASYKEEYAQLISQAQAIKTDLENVQAKVDRSIALLKSLVIERERWESSSETFRSQMSTIVGDVLLSAAFIAYGGYFDQHYRQNLFTTWTSHLAAANIKYRADIARTEYLSNPDERLRWQANALPTDELCVENAIMLKRFNRYPLIIDPSGQATEFIMREFKERKITKTSFLDDSFRKNLESALRFGNPLLVQDVENYDPILNPVLNRELRRTGGRVLITLGDQDIDLSPSFVIFLSTRDPTVEFPPDMCSRVTFVNFTVTRSSLQSQCLHRVLKAERPDIDTKRSDLLKLQGEFHLRLRQLEKSLLQALNDAKGKILDDDSVIATLETLKKEADDIGQKVEETDKVIAEIETVSQQYLPLSQACSSIYFTMESLNQVHFLYQYSLKMFLDIFSTVLVCPLLNGVTDYTARLKTITEELFTAVYERVARGMLHTDRLTFALLLCRIQLKGAGAEDTLERSFGVFLAGKDGYAAPAHAPDQLTPQQRDAAARLANRLPAFRNLLAKAASLPELGAWLAQAAPEQCVPTLWDSEPAQPPPPHTHAMYRLLLIQAFRPDRVIAAATQLVTAVLGSSFMAKAETELDLTSITEHQLNATTPALLCSVPGYDASGRVDDMATDLNKPLSSIAIGSAEGFNQAERAINTACKTGRWVMLKNVHLAPVWLVQLEKKLHSLSPHPSFRLFLTTEISPKLPVNLLRAGRVLVFEPPPGIRANLLRTFATVCLSVCVSVSPHSSPLFLTTEISPKLPVNLLRAGRVLVFEPPPGIRANLLRTFATVCLSVCVSVSPHSSPLFLTTEISPKLPVNLLRAGRVLVFEPPPGIRANLLRTFATVCLSVCVSVSPHSSPLFLTTEISPKLPVNLLRAGRVLVFEPPPGIRANLLRTFATVCLSVCVSVSPHSSPLFLTTEISPKLPVNLLRAGRVLVFEPPPGIRANLLRTFATVPAARMMKPPSERARLYFLLAWFHGIVQERLRYVPLGWAKYYEFNESDLRVACDTLDTWIDATAMGRTNLPPEKVPWEALVTLLSQCIYGGKIDNLFDQRLLHSFLCKLFTPRSFEADFALVANVDGATGNQRHITMPDGNRRDHFLKWIEELSDRQTPSWLGLPNNAEKVLLTTQGSDLVSKLLKMQQLEDEEELAYNAATQDDPMAMVVEGDGRPAWMKTLHQTATTWLELLPKELPTLRRTVENIKDPLYRFFEREVAAGAALLQQVLHDLTNVIAICQGSMKQTNETRAMVGALVRGMLPGSWRRYAVARGCTVQQWVLDFAHRVAQLATVSAAVAQQGAKRLQSIPVWLGGLLNPEAYITATRQCVAQANSWSLEELHLQVTIPDPGSPADASQTEWSFTVTDLKLQGATVKGNRLLLTNTIMVDLPLTVLTWIRGSEPASAGQSLTLPVYLNSARSELLFTVRLPIAPAQEPHAFYERGVALLTSTALN